MEGRSAIVSTTQAPPDVDNFEFARPSIRFIKELDLLKLESLVFVTLISLILILLTMTADQNQTFNLEMDKCMRFVRQFSSHKSFVAEFLSKYKYIVAYHSTKLSEKEHESIKKRGLLISDKTLLTEKAKARFVVAADNLQLQNEIKLCIDNYFRSDEHIDLGEVNFVLDRKIFESSYQYLLLGPEFLLRLADKLTKKFGISFRNRMFTFGKPAIISTQIPVNLVEERWLLGIYEYTCNDAFDCSLVLKESLPKEYLLSINYVEKPFNKYAIPIY